MARVTAAEVKEIMDNCTVSDTIINSFISAGTIFITDVFSSDTDLSDDQLKEIERWFVAHMIASTIHKSTSDEKLGDAAVKYTGQWGMGLDSTSYGQMVKLLDTTGKIGRSGKAAASMRAVKSFDD